MYRTLATLLEYASHSTIIGCMHHAPLVLIDSIMVSICPHVFVHIHNRVWRAGKMYHIRVNIHPINSLHPYNVQEPSCKWGIFCAKWSRHWIIPCIRCPPISIAQISIWSCCDVEHVCTTLCTHILPSLHHNRQLSTYKTIYYSLPHITNQWLNLDYCSKPLFYQIRFHQCVIPRSFKHWF